MKRYSAIITAFKEEKTIGKAIRQIISQLPKNSEVLVVAPDEPTLSVARKLAENDGRIKILKDPGKGKPTALNLGFRKVKGKIHRQHFKFAG